MDDPHVVPLVDRDAIVEPSINGWAAAGHIRSTSTAAPGRLFRLRRRRSVGQRRAKHAINTTTNVAPITDLRTRHCGPPSMWPRDVWHGDLLLR
jgi:hypothetical protein